MAPLPPEIESTLDKMMRADLDAWSNLWFWCLVGSTVAVAIGIICEAPEILQSVRFGNKTIAHIRKFWYTRIQKIDLNGWERLSPELVLTNTQHGKWIIRIGLVGWTLVALGVAGEGVAEYFVNSAETNLRAFDEEVLAETQSKSLSASERAASAYVRAAQTEQEASQENERAAKALEAAETARKEAEGFQLQIAQANERASKSEKEAEQLRKDAETERLARVNLEQKLAWRQLSEAQAERIAKKLWPFAGQVFDFVTYGSEGECLNFQNVLYRVVLGGRWTLNPKRTWHMLMNLMVGVEVQVDEKADKSTKDAAAALADALQAEGVQAALKPTPNMENPSVIVIAVGKSPASMAPIE